MTEITEWRIDFCRFYTARNGWAVPVTYWKSVGNGEAAIEIDLVFYQ